MKKIALGLIVGLILGFSVSSYAADVWKVQIQKARIVVNGKYWASKEKPALSINGTTYLPIKEIGNALNLPVYWIGKVVIGFDVPVAEKKIIIPDKDIWKAGNLQITFLTNSYEQKRENTKDKYIALDIELKNISNADMAVNMINIYIHPNFARDFSTKRDGFLSGITLKPGEAIKGTLAFIEADVIGPYTINYSADGKVYKFTYTNRDY